MAAPLTCRPEFFDATVRAPKPDPLILLPYSPGTRPQEQDRAMKALAQVLNQERVKPTQTIPAICRPGDDFAYWGWLRTAWGMARSRGEDLLVIEHDIQLTLKVYRALIDCPEPWCAGCYQIPSTRWGLNEPMWVHRVNPGPWQDHQVTRGVIKISFPDEPPVYSARCIKPGEQWADYAGLGCVRIRPDRDWPLPEPVHWSYLDTALSEALRVRWHLHWPALAHG